MLKKLFIRVLAVSTVAISLYGLGRLYFYLTAGFTLENISSDFAYQPQWDVRPLSLVEERVLSNALNQPFYYLGKGCQAYVFKSEDGNYVIKFFKYQRYRLQSWLNYFPPLPAIVQYRNEKREKKWNKLNGFVTSWKIAFENLKEETGLVYVHLNKTSSLNKTLKIYDKMGFSHLVDLDQMEFCIQKNASLLCSIILNLKDENRLEDAKLLISRLMKLILSEYERGLADNDHALMQNTGVVNGQPIHIDVGQFVFNDQVKLPTVWHQELFTKTYKFKLWLKEAYPELADYLELQLESIIGPSYSSLKPKFRVKN